MGSLSIFLYAVIANDVLAANSGIRDKIKIKSCHNPISLQPEMKIEAPAELKPENLPDEYIHIGDNLSLVEITIPEDQLNMVYRDDDQCEF